MGKPTLPTKLISYRKIKAIDLQVLFEEMSTTKLCQDSPNKLNDLAECYNLTLASIIDRHAPLLTKTLTIRPLVAWFNNDIKKARRQRRKAEIRWRRTRSASHFKEFKARKNHTTRLITKARCEFLKDFIDRNSFNQKNLFLATKRLLKQDHEVPFPPFKDKLTFANQMGSFFVEKIKSIHSKLDGLSSSLPVIEKPKHGGDYTPFWFSEGNVHILPLLYSSQRLFVQRNNVKHRRHFVFFRVSENTHSCGITGISRWPQKVRYQKQDFIGDTTDENTPTYTILLFSSTCFTRW